MLTLVGLLRLFDRTSQKLFFRSVDRWRRQMDTVSMATKNNTDTQKNAKTKMSTVTFASLSLWCCSSRSTGSWDLLFCCCFLREDIYHSLQSTVDRTCEWWFRRRFLPVGFGRLATNEFLFFASPMKKKGKSRRRSSDARQRRSSERQASLATRRTVVRNHLSPFSNW